MISNLRKEKHISHYTLDEAIAVVKQTGVPESYFTHISHQLGKHNIVEESLPEGIHLGYDGLILNV